MQKTFTMYYKKNIKNELEDFEVTSYTKNNSIDLQKHIFFLLKSKT